LGDGSNAISGFRQRIGEDCGKRLRRRESGRKKEEKEIST
jgi:hypothetical protein